MRFNPARLLAHTAALVAVYSVHLGLTAAQEVTTLVDSINASGGLSVGPNGNLYVADFGARLNNANGTTVYRVSPQGEVEVFATGFAGASGNAFDSAGNLIQANIGGNRLDQIDPSGNVTTIASNGLAGPVGVAIDSTDTIFVANCGGNSIVRIESGSGVVLASGGLLSCPNGLAIDPEGNLYTANFNNGDVIRVTQDGQTSVLATTPSSTFRSSGGNGHITYGNGQLYVVSNASAQVFALTLAGELSVVAGDGSRGHSDGPGASASFSSPNGIDLSADGRVLYVNEASSTQGTVLNIPQFPLNPSLVRQISLPASLSINPGMNGAWFNPNTAGQGLLLDVIASSQTLFAAWFTFETAEQQAIVSGDQHRWVTLQGNYQDTTATLGMFVSDGGIFDDPAEVTTVQNGSATLSFISCTEATLEYALDAGPGGTIALSRLTPDVLCADLTEQ